MILYGIPTCDSCRRALKELRDNGREVAFRDVRAEPLSEAEIAEIVQEFGDRAVNRQSTSYRAFSEFLRASDPEAQIAAQPTVMKRPIIRSSAGWSLGWDEAAQKLQLNAE